MLVEALLVERGRRAARDDDVVGVLRRSVLLRGEQDFAAAELNFVELRRLRILLHHAIERGERLLRLARRLVRARQLVEHLVVARIVRVGLQQRRIELDGFAALDVDGGDLGRHAIDLAGLEVQVAEAAHGFGAQLGVGFLQLEEALVVLHRLGGSRGHLGVLLDFDLLGFQVADGLRAFLVGCDDGLGQGQCDGGSDDVAFAGAHHGLGSCGALARVAPVPAREAAAVGAFGRLRRGSACGADRSSFSPAAAWRCQAAAAAVRLALSGRPLPARPHRFPFSASASCPC